MLDSVSVPAGGAVPLTLFCGWLGAGKTTLLGRLLIAPALTGRRLAVLINEFGRLPVDGALLPPGGYSLAEVNRGNIFCACVKADLCAQLTAIAREVRPELLLVEATGLAEPGDIRGLLGSDFLSTAFRPGPTVAVVDAVNFLKLVHALPAIRAQVQAADFIFLNKAALAGPEATAAVTARIRDLNPAAILVAEGEEDKALGWEMLSGSPGAPNREKASSLACGPPANVYPCAFRGSAAADRGRFYAALDRHRQAILRAKGVVCFGGDDWQFVEVVNGVVSTARAGAVLRRLAGDGRVALDFVLRSPVAAALTADLELAAP